VRSSIVYKTIQLMIIIPDHQYRERTELALILIHYLECVFL
jgi:hypothetical protein